MALRVRAAKSGARILLWTGRVHRLRFFEDKVCFVVTVRALVILLPGIAQRHARCRHSDAVLRVDGCRAAFGQPLGAAGDAGLGSRIWGQKRYSAPGKRMSSYFLLKWGVHIP